MTRYTARQLPRHLGPAAWGAILPSRPAGPVLEEDQSVDFVIVGGGFAGLAAARRLTQLVPNSRIAVLEAGQLAEGAAGRNSGFMIDLPHELTSDDYAGMGDDRALISLNRKAQTFAQEAVQAFGINPAFFDPSGKINGAGGPAAEAHNLSYARHLEDLGEAYEILDAAQMKELTGSTYYHSGLYTPGTVLLQPAGFIRGMAEGLRADGVSIYENSPVTSFTQQGQSWRVETPKATLSTGRVILTVNGHLESFGQAQGRLMHLFLFATMTPRLDESVGKKLGGKSRWGITPSDPMGTTVRRIDTAQGGDRIVTRTCAVLRSGMVAKTADMRRASRTMQRKFDSRFPQLAGMQMEHTWAGHLCLTSNANAHMQEIDTGVFSGCVQNGLGTARGTLTGIGAAEMACGQKSDITRHFGAQVMPKPLPSKPFRDMGANVVIRFKEWRAKSE